MTDTTKRAEFLAMADRLGAWANLISSGYNVPAAGTTMTEAASALRRLAAQDQKTDVHPYVKNIDGRPLYLSPPPAAGWDEALRSLMKAGKIMAVCELCSSSYPEGCGHCDLDDLRETPDGAWVCENCWDGSGDNPIWEDLSHVESLRATPAATKSADAGGEDWRDDPSADERWNAGLDFAMQQLCKVLDVDPAKVTWDAATETVDGDVRAVIWNILRAKMGEDWKPAPVAANASAEARLRDDITDWFGQIADLSTALRQGGPDPMDLQDLSGNLERACEIAGEALEALSAHPHASDCDKQGCMGDNSPGDAKDLQELLSKPSVLEPSDRPADVTAARYVSLHEKPTPYEREVLTILQEECAELIVQISKALRFGLGDGYPGGTETNYEAIGREIGDLDAMVGLALKADLYSSEARTTAARDKIERLKKFMQNAADAAFTVGRR